MPFIFVFCNMICSAYLQQGHEIVYWVALFFLLEILFSLPIRMEFLKGVISETNIGAPPP